jgi:hypothetical protein
MLHRLRSDPGTLPLGESAKRNGAQFCGLKVGGISQDCFLDGGDRQRTHAGQQFDLAHITQASDGCDVLRPQRRASTAGQACSG